MCSQPGRAVLMPQGWRCPGQARSADPPSPSRPTGTTPSPRCHSPPPPLPGLQSTVHPLPRGGDTLLPAGMNYPAAVTPPLLRTSRAPHVPELGCQQGNGKSTWMDGGAHAYHSCEDRAGDAARAGLLTPGVNVGRVCARSWNVTREPSCSGLPWFCLSPYSAFWPVLPDLCLLHVFSFLDPLCPLPCPENPFETP